jgi:hypothetical protein
VPIFELEHRWEKLLKKHGLDYFKASQCENGRSRASCGRCSVRSEAGFEFQVKLDELMKEQLGENVDLLMTVKIRCDST